MKIRTAIKLLCPPVLWDLGRKIKSHLDNDQLPNPLFRGPVDSWEEAVARSDGWDSSVITAKTLDLALKVRDGVIEFEQDTVIQRTINYSPTILAFIILTLARHKNRLSIIDFGGGLATNYFQNRRILQHLVDTPFMWNIIERPVFAQLGMQHLANSNLRFFLSLDEAVAELPDFPDAFLFSGSLQCVAEPMSLLDKAIALGAKTLAFDRLLVSPVSKHDVFIQHPDPQIYYPATYPVWCFSKDLFIQSLTSKGFSLVEHFTWNPDAHFDRCGMVFVSES